MDELARTIFDASPSTADDLIFVIDQWRSLMQANVNSGAYGPDTHPDNPELAAVFRERLARIDRLRNALDQIRSGY
jgi:hypothetical protein